VSRKKLLRKPGNVKETVKEGTAEKVLRRGVGTAGVQEGKKLCSLSISIKLGKGNRCQQKMGEKAMHQKTTGLLRGRLDLGGSTNSGGDTAKVFPDRGEMEAKGPGEI